MSTNKNTKTNYFRNILLQFKNKELDKLFSKYNENCQI